MGTMQDRTRADLLQAGELGEPLADHLLDCLRMAAALKVEHGPHVGLVYDSVRTSLITLLATQSVDDQLANESINHALITGKGIAAAVAHVARSTGRTHDRQDH